MLGRIGQLVKAVREDRALSQEEVANSAGLALALLERLESGSPGMTTSQLSALAKALELDPDALLRGEAVARREPSVFLRHTGMQDFHDTDLDILDAAIEQGRTLGALARIVGDEVGLWPRGTFPTSEASAEAAQQAYLLAKDLRRAIGLPTQALGDVRKLIEINLGIAVVVRRLATPGVAAVAVKTGDAAAIVLSESALRRRGPAARVSLSHEICHVLHDHDSGGVHVVIDLEVDSRAHRAEQRARAFAAEALLPVAGLIQVLGEPKQIQSDSDARRLVTQAREVFGTPWQIAANHLCNRGFIDLQLRPWLEALDGPPLSKPWDTRLPAVDGPSLLVAERARRAHEAGLITDGEARAALGIGMLERLPWEGR